MFSQVLINKITALKYVLIVFKKKNYHCLVYIHCLYIGNGLIQGKASIIVSSFFIVFYIDKMITLKYRFKGCFSVSIKLSKNFPKTCNKRWTHFWEIQFQNYATLYQHLWQQHEMHLQKGCGAYVILLLYCITEWWRIWDMDGGDRKTSWKKKQKKKNQSCQKSVKPTKLVDFEGIARHQNVNIMLYEPKMDRGKNAGSI